MRIKVLQKAKRDLLAAREFYDSQEQGLGGYFSDVMVSEIDALAWYAGIHVRYHGYYKAVTRKFPYSIYYKVAGEVVKVYAVLDNRRNPATTADRLA